MGRYNRSDIRKATGAVSAALSRSQKAVEDAKKAVVGESEEFEPRVKQTTDQEWIAKHGTDQVDIANTHYNDLPRDWQKENYESARSAIDAVHAAWREASDEARDFERGFPSKAAALREEIIVDRIAPIIHEEWRKRNTWLADHLAEHGEPHPQDVPFDQLPEEEKEKDRAVARVAVAAYPGDGAREEHLEGAAQAAAAKLHDAWREGRRKRS